MSSERSKRVLYFDPADTAACQNVSNYLSGPAAAVTREQLGSDPADRQGCSETKCRPKDRSETGRIVGENRSCVSI
jgi:hypothetical protein